jgi:undecaprenyl-diphosphatase
MDFFQAIILGLVQGLGEFLPISSSGHLVLAPWLFGWKDPGLSFDVALHFGTLIAVLWYFKKDWFNIFKEAKSGGVKNIKKSLLFFIVIATIPGVFAGLLLNDYAETVFRSPIIIACTLATGGLLLYLIDKKIKHEKSLELMNWKTAIVIGVAQALAIIPGVSRSGITITAALALGISRKDSARFSFLLSTPIIFGAVILKADDFLGASLNMETVIGMVVAGISGYLAISLLIKFVEKASYAIFFWYRLALAVVIVAFLVLR